ncbi:hypothetical protein GCM10029978_079110 [Actinoallomurus acanthiterrae]
MTTALVTGAGGALGRATARRLARDGAPVAALDVDAATLAETTSLIERAGGTVLPLVADLRDAAAIEAAVATAAERLGPVRVLVNNAAVYPAGRSSRCRSPSTTTSRRSTSGRTGSSPRRRPGS